LQGSPSASAGTVVARPSTRARQWRRVVSRAAVRKAGKPVGFFSFSLLCGGASFPFFVNFDFSCFFVVF